MILRTLPFVLFFGISSSLFANTHYVHPKEASSTTQNTFSAGACDIEIINDSYDDIKVYGRFDDGSSLVPFVIKQWQQPMYVSLFYFGTCHIGMDFYIETIGGKYKYNGFTPVGKTVKITNY